MKTDETQLPKNRIESLADGIFAFAMTLMVLDLKTPDNIPVNVAPQELPSTLLKLLPAVEAYAISFLVLGTFWLRHQVQFRFITSSDRILIAINLFFLMLICFVPFTVGIMIRYISYPLSIQIYVINLIVISLVLTLQWKYVCVKSQTILSPEMDAMRRRRFLIVSTIPVLIFTISLIISTFSIRLAFFVIYLDPIFYLVYRRFVDKKNLAAGISEAE